MQRWTPRTLKRPRNIKNPMSSYIGAIKFAVFNYVCLILHKISISKTLIIKRTFYRCWWSRHIFLTFNFCKLFVKFAMSATFCICVWSFYGLIAFLPMRSYRTFTPYRFKKKIWCFNVVNWKVLVKWITFNANSLYPHLKWDLDWSLLYSWCLTTLDV